MRYLLSIALTFAGLVPVACRPTSVQRLSVSNRRRIDRSGRETQKVLDEINPLNPYQTPPLPLKKEGRYAGTSRNSRPSAMSSHSNATS